VSYVFKEKKAARIGAPLIFTLHGTGGDENQLFGFAEKLLPEAAIVAPRGDVSEHGALRFFRRKAEGVYDFADLAARSDTMAEFVRSHRDVAHPGQTIGLGYSNGANILAAVALANPDLFDELVLMHPLVSWTPPDDPRLARLKVLITAGRGDPICPPELTNALAEFLKRQGTAVTLAWHDGGHEVRPSEEAVIAGFLAGQGAPGSMPGM
jgi:phospholipase/carboxylesterase